MPRSFVRGVPPSRAASNAPSLALALALALTFAAGTTARAHERLARVYDERDGLAVAEIFQLAQDAKGFLWIGGSGGIVRFDGRDFRRWAPESIRHVVRSVCADSTGQVLVTAADEPLWILHGDSLAALRGPDRRPVRDWRDAALSADGTAGVLWSDRVGVREPLGRWRVLPGPGFDESGLESVLPWAGDTLLVSTARALYAVSGGGARRVADFGRVVAARPWPDGGMVALTSSGELWRVVAGERELLLRGGRGVGLAVRGRRIWASMGANVLGLAPGSPPDTIAPSSWCPLGRSPFVDREGNLWLGAFGGLVQMPEPATRIWGPAEGLPSPAHAFGVARAGDRVRVMTWFGAADVDPRLERGAVRSAGKISGGCFPDAQGRLWWSDLDEGFRVREPGPGNARERFYPEPGLHRVAASFPRRDGTTWLATDDGPYLARPDGGRPARCGSPPPAAWGAGWRDTWIQGVVEDEGGRLWLARGAEVASADAESLARGGPVAWRVEALPGAEQVNALRLLEGGDLWAATSIAGVWRRHAGRWAEEPASAGLPSLRVYNLERARGGGWWLLADGWIGRVEPRPAASGGGWRVLETLSAWQGLPTLQASGLLEDADGGLWIASLRGLVEVPAIARLAPRAVPGVDLVEARADGRSRPLDSTLTLPWRRNDLELRFTAHSFRDPSHLRYQARMLPGGDWMETREPVFHAVDLGSGRHTFEVRASLDGEHWSAEPARLSFAVARPWYLEPWALVALALWGAALAWAAHRVRVAMLLRLERQRMRIAMDLHDEMGSGLGSIGILAGLAADGPLEDGARRRLAGEIAALSSDLGATLSEIVRSLREGPDTLDRWVSQLVERAQRLVPGPRPELRLALPAAIPSVALASEVRRELMLAAVEALHNAVRHADARVITLGFEPEGGRWRLWIEDDGRGLPPDAFARQGSFGLGNMRRRLQAVHGEVEWSARCDGGTRVEMRFAPAPAVERGGRLARMFVRNRGGGNGGRIES